MVGYKLLNFKRRSFYIDHSLICKNAVIFFQIEDLRWFSLSIGEGCINLIEEPSAPECQSLDEIQDSFAYPVENLVEMEFAKNSFLDEIYEYRLLDNPEYSFGLCLKLNIGEISFIEDNGDVSISLGKSDELLEFSFLKTYKIN